MKRSIKALCVLAMMNGGCSPIVLDSVEPQPEAEVESQAEAEVKPLAAKALAMRFGDWAPVFDDYISDIILSGLYTELPQDPDALVLFFSNLDQECSRPQLPRGAEGDFCDLSGGMPFWKGGPFWQVAFVIPPELNRNGLIDLQDNRIVASAFAHDPNYCDLDGTWSVGLFQGTLEIVGRDAASISVKLRSGPTPQGVQAVPGIRSDIDGDHAAVYCGDAIPESEP